jgi:hypothetical protein
MSGDPAVVLSLTLPELLLGALGGLVVGLGGAVAVAELVTRWRRPRRRRAL